MICDGQGPSGVAELGHVLGGSQAMTHHVAYGQVGPPAGQSQRVIPVPSDLPRGSGLPVAGADIQARNHR